MNLGLNNLLALQGQGQAHSRGHGSLASSLFGQGGGASAFGTLLGQGQKLTDIQTTPSLILDSQLNPQLNNQANSPAVATLNGADIVSAHNALPKVFFDGHEDLHTSEEVQISTDVKSNAAKTSVPDTTADDLMLEGFVSLNSKGELQITDENGVVVDAEFIKLLEENPLVKAFLAEKLQTGEKISLSENVLFALANKSKDTIQNIVVENNALVLNLAQRSDVAAQNAQKSNEWNASQKAENSIINPVAQDTKAAPASNQNTQQSTQQTQAQSTASSSSGEGFSMNSGTDGGSDFSQNFNGDGIDSVDADWAQTQTQKNNTVQNFTSHLNHLKPATPQYVSVAEQVSMQIQKGLQGQIDKISLQLNPSDLGKVTINFDFSDSHNGKILISADKPETLDMLRQDARTLQKILSDAGMDAGKNSLEFSLGHNQDQSQNADKSKKINDMKFDITSLENLGTEIESIVIPSSGIIAVGKVNIVV